MGRDEIGRALVEFGRELEQQGAAQVGASFTPIPEADAFVRDDPAAFLIGVLFTQGIPAERAWAGPWLLSQRLGHFDLERLAAEPDAVRDAFQMPPMLHRFKNTVPKWVSAAASRIVSEYGGDASRVWETGSHVLEVTERLAAFPGIGRKKSVMAVEILTRHLGVDLVGRECGQIAYDVQVRRVFLRTGLVSHDSIEAIESVAAELCPDSPGTLDLATWLIGRQTCRPRTPLCDACRLGAVCPRLTELNVAGVGARAR